jgi:hypothetical protein
MKNHPKLFSGALAAYGSWNKALMAAGITAIPRKTRLGLLRELCDVVESKRKVSQALSSELEYYFGSLRNAKAALKTDPKLLSGWSKRKIITVLAQKYRSQEKLNYGAVRRDFPPCLMLPKLISEVRVRHSTPLESARTCISCIIRGANRERGRFTQIIDDDTLKQLFRINDELFRSANG